MNSFFQRVLNATKMYSVLDFACLKIALVSAGILIGVYFTQFFMAYTAYLWIAYGVSFVWILYRTFVTHLRE